MLLPGFWLLCEDGVVRPVFRGEMATAEGSSVPLEFLADIGADRTVLCAAVLDRFGWPRVPANQNLGGAGGAAETVIVETAIHLQRDDTGTAVFRGKFAAFTELEALDMSVLEDGALYHTYSTYARGLDVLWGMYQWLDRAPRGRNETGIWLRRHDEYEPLPQNTGSSCQAAHACMEASQVP